LQLLWLPQLVVQLPPPLQWKVQPPPGHVKAQFAPSVQVISQLPPAQSLLHVDWPPQAYTQPPPAHVESQLALPAQ
jgi:hypothetical protein